jgi:glyoxylase-like metal-dependent hydrolase (beta-lactamase superfamily II)
VLDERPFLVDTGRFGMGQSLLDMMKSAGFSPEDLDYVFISHGHEDHDGALAEVARSTGAKVKAHLIYDRLIRYYPGNAPPDFRRDFPAICWRCFMPESFSTENCLEYQRSRSKVEIEAIRGGNRKLSEDVAVHHVPGHSPDSLAIIVGGDAILVGDTVLPNITPWPSQEGFFFPVRKSLEPEYSSAQEIFGLRAYIRSLKKLREIGKKCDDLIVLPAHRLFYRNRWNEINLETRIDETIEHHIRRCGSILKIIGQGPKTAKDIAVEYFEETLLKGYGILMAENEVISHCELLKASGDVVTTEETKYVSTGSTSFETLIQSLTPDG